MYSTLFHFALSGVHYDNGLEMGGTFPHSITPPAGFFDHNGVGIQAMNSSNSPEPHQLKLDSLWPNSTFNPGGVKVLPTERTNGGPGNGYGSARFGPLAEGIEQSYTFSQEGNSDVPLRAWTEALAP